MATNFNVDILDPIDGQELIYSDGAFKNSTPTGIANSAYGSIVQYVEQDGNDSNSGYSRQLAKKTVAAAVASLNGGTHTGVVKVGCGVFEEDPMEIKQRLRIYGQGPEGGDPNHGGTTIRLKANSNAPLFNYPYSAPGSQYYNHYNIIEKLTLDGNKANQSGNYDILRLDGGGFNCMLRDLHFRNAGRWGIWLEKKAINVQMSNMTGSYCGSLPSGVEVYDHELHGGFLCFNATEVSGNDNIVMVGNQLDVCGRYPIFVNYKKGYGGNMVIIGLKLETGGVLENNWAAIGYDGASDSVHNKLNIHVIGGRSDNYGNTGNKAFFHQVAGSIPANVILQQVGSSGDATIYLNSYSGETFEARNSVESLPLYSNIGRMVSKDLNVASPTYADDAAAGFGGLVKNDIYFTATGEVRVKL